MAETQEKAPKEKAPKKSAPEGAPSKGKKEKAPAGAVDHAPKAAEEIAELMLREVRAKFPEVAIAQHPTSNIQHPTSSEHRISKRQVANATVLGVSMLMLLWCLAFGVWCLPSCS